MNTTSVCQVSIMGTTLNYIQTAAGVYLYEQKRHLTPKVWARQVAQKLLKAGFTIEQAQSFWTEIKSWYFNRRFYKSPREIVQHFIELSC